MMQVDLRPGLFEGDRTDMVRSKCYCYAYDDLAKLNMTAPGDRGVARGAQRRGDGALPLDGQAGQQLRGHGWLASTRACGTAASSTRTPCTATRGTSYFVVEEQSSVFHKLALEPGYHFEDATLNTAGLAYKTAEQRGRPQRVHARVRGPWPSARHRRSARPGAPAPHELCDPGLQRGRDRANCWCIDEDLLQPANDHLIVHDARATGLKRRCTAPSCAWEWPAARAQRGLPQGRAAAPTRCASACPSARA